MDLLFLSIIGICLNGFNVLSKFCLFKNVQINRYVFKTKSLSVKPGQKKCNLRFCKIILYFMSLFM